MTFRALMMLCLVGWTSVNAQMADISLSDTDNLPAESSASKVPPVAVAPIEPEYLAPAPPVDQDDSREAMLLLDNQRKIAVGDQVEFMVIEDREPPEVLLVDEDGNVEIPLIGGFPAVGRTAQELAFAVSEALKKDYYYQATVVFSQYQATKRRGEVYVMGEVAKEGMVDIPSGDILRVSDAIMRAGGFSLYANSSRVSLIRPNAKNPEASERFEINVGQILETGDLSQDLMVRANDRVFVARRGDTSGQYTLTGAVNRPGVFPISIGQKITLSEAILQAGGFSQFGDGSDVKLIRYAEDGSRTELEINVEEILDKGMQENDVLLKNGDRIIVDEVWARLDF